jgi:transaldolase
MWLPVLDGCCANNRRDRGRDRVGARRRMVATRSPSEPVHRASGGRAGYLCVQVDPRLHRDAARMVDQARDLARIAATVAVKIPATAAGVDAVERLTAIGVRTNSTVCFTVAQAVACAEAVERGLRIAEAAGRDTRALGANVTIMVGRLEDHLRRVAEARDVTIDPCALPWSGVAVFKAAWRLFQERSYRATLLAAAYRHSLHWTELVGPGVVETMPYKWWRQFNASSITPRRTIDEPVADDTSGRCGKHFRTSAERWMRTG